MPLSHVDQFEVFVLWCVRNNNQRRVATESCNIAQAYGSLEPINFENDRLLRFFWGFI